MRIREQTFSRIQRSFRDLSEKDAKDIEQIEALMRMGWSKASNWDELLKSQRILIISEAGAGKTYECKEEHKRLWNKEEAAFYFELAELANNNPKELLSPEEEDRFNSWHQSQSDIATIFLDSIDELKLTQGSFSTALNRLSKVLSGRLNRTKLIITSRPVAFDFQVIEKYLPVPNESITVSAEESFADIVMNHHRDKKQDKDVPPTWRTVGLMPLSDDQIKEMALREGVTDADVMLEGIRKRNAEEFSRRPQDLVELCIDWRDHKRIRKYRDQIDYSIRVKLKPRSDLERKEKTALSDEDAFEGAKQLALAALLTRKLSFRHSAEADKGGEPGTALDPATILPDWPSDKRETLLERPLFGFASYGRVRFQHRSFIEYLAAKQLESMINKGRSLKAIKRMLFAETLQGVKIVKPTMNPVASWLAASVSSIFSEVRDRQPELLLDLADPESLSLTQRINALNVYVSRYGKGNWRGLNVPLVQVHRFASADLAPTILQLWQSRIDNTEVRELLLELISAGSIQSGADIAYSTAIDPDIKNESERISAFDALIQLNDSRINNITESIIGERANWSDRLIRAWITMVFPKHISIEKLCKVIGTVHESERSAGEIRWAWPRLISEKDISTSYLNDLHAWLVNLIMDKVKWEEKNWPHLQTSREDLIPALTATCLRLIEKKSLSPEVILSCVIALQLSRNDYDSDGPISKLREYTSNSSTAFREALFWAQDSFNQAFHPIDDPWHRLCEANHFGAISLSLDKDTPWIIDNLSSNTAPPEKIAMMLEAAIYLWDGKGEKSHYIESLKVYIPDNSVLLAKINSYLKPPKIDRKMARMEAKHQEYKEKENRRLAKNRASWIQFWREVANNPDDAFGSEKEDNTTWNLWRAMSNSGEQSRSSGWNRKFIEDNFGVEIADRVRASMMKAWRNDHPTLRSERPDSERNSYLTRWQLGLAAIYAEAEEVFWANKLTKQEAEHTLRYVSLELSGFPSWLEDLSEVHPKSVDTILGEELTRELDEIAGHGYHSSILQDISHASPSVATLFTPHLQTWLKTTGRHQNIRDGEETQSVVERLRKVTNILIKHGDDTIKKEVVDFATQNLEYGIESEFAHVWLPLLLNLHPSKGVERLELELSNIEPAPESIAVTWIAGLFDTHHSGNKVNLNHPAYTPQMLLKLVRLAYKHVRTCDDIQHEGCFTPNTRDRAQDGRNVLLSAVLNTEGSEGWKAKLELASDPQVSHFQDRARMLARQSAAEELDRMVLTEKDVLTLIQYGETPPTTRDEMHSLLIDRLDDLEDLLLQDESPREAWSLISDERIMRRAITRELKVSSNHMYTADQEGVTADEKETDIRLRSTASDQQSVIELKLGEKWSGRQLRDTIKNQLIEKYMAQDNCRSGCLLITVSKLRTWEHPEMKECLDVSDLKKFLEEETEKVTNEMGTTIRLMVRVLDLRSRLIT